MTYTIITAMVLFQVAGLIVLLAALRAAGNADRRIELEAPAGPAPDSGRIPGSEPRAA
jgi:hypothetical protein